MTFGAALRHFISVNGISASELSRRSGVSKQYISQLMSGKIADPTLNKAYAIARALNMKLQDFVDYMDGE